MSCRGGMEAFGSGEMGWDGSINAANVFCLGIGRCYTNVSGDVRCGGAPCTPR